jgi:hypothetical protein
VGQKCILEVKSDGQPTLGDSLAWELGLEMITSHHKKLAFYEMQARMESEAVNWNKLAQDSV